MFLTACLLAAFGVAVCVIAFRACLGFFGLAAMDTLVWLGLAEVPAPPAPRRRVGV